MPTISTAENAAHSRCQVTVLTIVSLSIEILFVKFCSSVYCSRHLARHPIHVAFHGILITQLRLAEPQPQPARDGSDHDILPPNPLSERKLSRLDF